MGLLDADRFEGRFREGVHKADVSDMMRRLTKEELYRFDGTPLFPERLAYTASYELSRDEGGSLRRGDDVRAAEMNRADRSGDGGAETMSASRSRSCNGGLPPRRRRSTAR